MHEMVARAINDPALMSAGLALSEGRFEQAYSIDGGQSWEDNWIAIDTRR